MYSSIRCVPWLRSKIQRCQLIVQVTRNLAMNLEHSFVAGLAYICT